MFDVLEARIEEHHQEYRLRFDAVEDRVRLVEQDQAAGRERHENITKLLEDIKKKVEAPRWWVIFAFAAPLFLAVLGLVFQAGRYPDRDEFRQVSSRLAQVEMEIRLQRLMLDTANRKVVP